MYFKSNKDCLLMFPEESRPPEVLLEKASTFNLFVGKALLKNAEKQTRKVQLVHLERVDLA